MSFHRRFLLIRTGSWTFRVERRTLAVTGLLGAVITGMVIFALMLGDYPLGPGDVIASLLGTGDDPLAQFFVRDLRAPRVVTALLIGAALGTSGAIFQTLTGNPLGSPDITGFTVGAATGALLQIIVFGGGPLAIGLGALFGGFATGTLVYLLSRSNGITGTRFVLIGIGVAAILQGVNGLLIVRASLTAAQTAAQWLAGSFNATTWGETLTLTVILMILIPCALALSRPLGVMLTGPDLAVGLGVPVDTRRIQLIIIGVALVAVTVAVAGPIAFIALAAPQLARRLTRTSGPGLGTAALMGGFLVLTSDVISQRLFAPTQLPVGVVTGSLGGVYLIWLLAHEWRKDHHA
ncbi:FecCD family ABC transporter permease [Corynebacterium pygosceleis]|uniref:FecCD family ABC transporter permease n=1 Tax=Corynebacterium pygosceleis TaxID=2800406 RepID=UPI002005BC6C|nr:iron chelate uptake ABC transporter family permease subunit [Corynebacterium pygosceleis]